MAYITYGDQDGAIDPMLARQYERCRNEEHDCVDNILRIHSYNPPSLKAHLELYGTLMFGKSELTRRQREMIAIVVSRANECFY